MSSMSNNTLYQVAQEDYEEYEILKRNKDENEVIMMQLKNNNDRLDKEIKELKEKINKKKKKNQCMKMKLLLLIKNVLLVGGRQATLHLKILLKKILMIKIYLNIMK